MLMAIAGCDSSTLCIVWPFRLIDVFESWLRNPSWVCRVFSYAKSCTIDSFFYMYDLNIAYLRTLHNCWQFGAHSFHCEIIAELFNCRFFSVDKFIRDRRRDLSSRYLTEHHRNRDHDHATEPIDVFIGCSINFPGAFPSNNAICVVHKTSIKRYDSLSKSPQKPDVHSNALVHNSRFNFSKVTRQK